MILTHTDTPAFCAMSLKIGEIGSNAEKMGDKSRFQRLRKDFVVKELTFSFSAVISD